LDKDLLSILACPETHQGLSEAPQATLLKLNAGIAGGGVSNCGGDPVEAAVEAGLVREDGQILYPIRDGIPILLTDEGIPL
ncbi:MAG: hypothetical protein QF724_07810, partial [Planctomycetota bacterium]|nr:hypothetical protein [Planctomycetota bacterium]